MKNHGERPRIGILGSGQLAKMMAQAAVQLGCRIKVLTRSEGEEPLFGWPAIVGDWNDPETLIAFAEDTDVVTLENEFIESNALAELEAAGYLVLPSSSCMALVQDKYIQKQTLSAAGLPTAAFRAVNGPEDILDAAASWGWPVVLKRRKLGYDGKGNATLRSKEEISEAWRRLGGDGHALYVEQFCAFERELAIMVTRGTSGLVAYPVVDTVQRDHICHTVSAPSRLDAAAAATAASIGQRAVEAIGAVGCVGVEMFLMQDGRILVNELAPRVHNSGHFTIEACHCSQFENHIRAILGWPLGSPNLRAPAAAMVNLLGAADGPAMPQGLEKALAVAGAHIHIYGKARSAKGRKMGHVTALGATADEALEIATRAASAIRFG
jgi:5-(carboxyamino)imidazole ribonucleotide synthase